MAADTNTETDIMAPFTRGRPINKRDCYFMMPMAISKRQILFCFRRWMLHFTASPFLCVMSFEKPPAMEFKPNDNSVTSESAPLIEPVDIESDQELFMVPLKRPSPRLPPSHYRNVKAKSPRGSPDATPTQCNLDKSPQSNVNPYQSPPMSGLTMKPESPPMFTSPLMSPESRGLGGSPNLQGSAAPTPGSLVYNSPPLSGRATKIGSSPILSTETSSARQSPQPESSGKDSKEHTTSASRSTDDKPNPSTKASSVYDNAPAITCDKPAEPRTTDQDQAQAPEIPPLSTARANLKSTKPETLGLALQLAPTALPNPDLLAPSSAQNPLTSPSREGWTVPDSPLERLSQLRATPDSAYDRARQMELRRSEWKHVVYRFPVKGKDHWVIDADLTESSHARLADVARRSSEGFEWNGDYELANIYRVLAAAHTRVMEEMREERRGVAVVAHRQQGVQVGIANANAGGGVRG
ncbi:uncharacterized protein B0T15DRAFT_537666 [Chaetomium strumarium]|uniref:Uncharacterized protein n=1 Tax=Chaetomium strumarium TaxID=1170767 RepID=A0AAJ0GRH4_9PEZI|nr:hypothetical protein B0T15DRAFT_537666 [Chaetomium strumarium]